MDITPSPTEPATVSIGRESGTATGLGRKLVPRQLLPLQTPAESEWLKTELSKITSILGSLNNKVLSNEQTLSDLQAEAAGPSRYDIL